jgi:hypothetical protein
MQLKFTKLLVHERQTKNYKNMPRGHYPITKPHPSHRLQQIKQQRALLPYPTSDKRISSYNCRFANI